MGFGVEVVAGVLGLVVSTAELELLPQSASELLLGQQPSLVQ